jgi:polyhydroxyalkanoate synthesis regulator phasin
MGLGDLVQKAVYLGVGMASLAGEKATEKLAELKVQAQKLADEMVSRGEMTTEEARRYVDDMLQKAQQPQVTVESGDRPATTAEPRRIEILTDDDDAPTGHTANSNTANSNTVNSTTVNSTTLNSTAASASTPNAATPNAAPNSVDAMRQKVLDLQAELRRLQNDG